MFQITALTTLGLLFPTLITSIDLTKEYRHSAFVDPQEKYQLHWNVLRNTKKMQFAVQVNITQGWIGFGISQGLSGQMKDADLVVGWVSGCKGYLKDRHGIGNTRPVLDPQQDYKLTGAMQADGQTILKFERSLITCDKHDQDIKDGTVKVMYAYNPAKTPDINDEDSLTYHGPGNQRGSKSFNLMAYITNEPRPVGVKYFDLLNQKVQVPSHHTTYWCQPFKIPDYINTKHHMIEIEPIVQKGNEALVHHIVVYECESNFNESHINTSGSCEDPAMPVHIKQCKGRNSVYAWAIGGKNFRLPEHVGLPIGVKGSIKYVVMETHYDNPGMLPGQMDSSGLRFYYTDKTRKYDAATIFVGGSATTTQLIPPGQKNFIQESFCSGELTQGLRTDLPDNSIRIFASFPHAHLAGVGIWSKHVRNGTELPEIIRDDAYDFNYQQTYLLQKEVTFLPGDSINTYCRYDTSKRKDATTGGESTRNEMCLNFLLYYPRTTISSCSSFAVGVMNFTLKYAKFAEWTKNYPQYKVYGANWTSIPWSQSMMDELNNIYRTSKIHETVVFQAPKQAISRTVDKPTVKVPLVVSDPCATKPNTTNPTTTYPYTIDACVPSSGAMTLLSLTALFISLVSSLQFM